MKPKSWKIKATSLLLATLIFASITQPFSVTAAEEQPTVTLTDSSQLWTPKKEIALPNYEGDLSLEELATAMLPAEDTPEIVSQDAIEENGHVNRLWEQEEDLNSIVFQNRDGTKTMYYYPDAVKYVDSDGVVRDKSNLLTENISQERFKSDYAYVNAANDIRTYFPKTLDKKTGVVLEGYGVSVDFTPLSFGTQKDVGKELTLGAESAYAREGSVQTEQKTDQDVVLYHNVFGKNTTLRFTPTFEGFKEDILLDCYTENNEFTYRVRTNGLTLISEEVFCYFLDPLTGEIKAVIDKIVVFDSEDSNKVTLDTLKNVQATKVTERTESSLGTEKKSTQLEEATKLTPSYNHHYRVEIVKPDEEYLVTLVVDEAYLKSEETVYPVTIDPSTTVIATGSGTSKTIVDAPIYSGRPTTVHGANNYSVIGYTPSYAGTYFGVGRELMKFPGLMSNTTFQNLSAANIYNVNVYMRATGGGSSSSRIDAYLYQGSNWTENTVTCQNSNWNSYTTLLDFSYLSYASWTYFDITTAAKAWKSGTANPDAGIILRNENESNANYQWNFATTEYVGVSSLKPFVTVNYYYDTNATTGLTSGGTYYIKNYTSGKYMEDNKSGGVRQNPKTTALDDIPHQRWRVTQWGQGLYSLQPMNGYDKNTNTYPYALTANTSGGLCVTQKSANVETNQLFILARNSDGTYHIRPAITGTGRSLTVANVSNGTAVTTATHSSSIPCMKWWFEEVNTFTATVNNYYDNGYRVRHNGTGSSAPNSQIASRQTWVNSKYSSILNLNITTNSPTLINSIADTCKTRRGLAINETTINELCPGGTGHTPPCSNADTLCEDFLARFPGDGAKASVLWSGNKLDDNRSYIDLVNNVVMIIDLPDDNIREEDERFTLLHELAHNFGAPDHYCEDPTKEDCGIELCYLHHPEKGYSSNCAMGQYIGDISSYSNEDIFCDKCIESMRQHLLQHH